MTCREGPVSVPSIRRKPGAEEKPEVGRVGHHGESEGHRECGVVGMPYVLVLAAWSADCP